jgi:hypothetical protein
MGTAAMSDDTTIATVRAERVYSDAVSEQWRGDCLSAEHVAAVMGERKADALVFDAPYSDRTHAGHDSASRCDLSSMPDPGKRPANIDFPRWSAEHVAAFVDIWAPRTAGWFATITDHVLAPSWEASLSRHGRYVFAPLPLVESGSRIRLTGDGPSCWTCWLVVARPKSREFASWGTLPGAYVVQCSRDEGRIVGGKPLLAMQCIIEDYSARGGLVVDPTSGGGTTGRAAKAFGRRYIGMEQDAGRAELSAKQLAAVKLDQAELFA